MAGNFNAIVDLEEKRGGNDVLSSHNRSFGEWINRTELIDLGHHGPCFTGTNKRVEVTNVSERLDKALENVAWSLKHPKTGVFHIPRFNSDHMPILVRTEPRTVNKSSSFRTENWWLARDDFKGICQTVVQQGNSEWEHVRSSLKREVRRWEAVKNSPQALLGKVESEMLSLNSQRQPEII